jgi:hypothetical protein
MGGFVGRGCEGKEEKIIRPEGFLEEAGFPLFRSRSR